jgi:CRISPR/Cas system-associated endonuclease Cas1
LISACVHRGSSKKGRVKREYLKEDKSRAFVKELNKYFTTIVKVPRVCRGKRQEFESLINEEALLFAKYLRNEKEDWSPRIQAV